MDAPRRAAELRPVIGYIGPRRRLLVVDDQPIQRQLLAALLVPLGFEVLEAASGREGLDIVAQQRPDALLLDMSMDDLDGWQTAELIRASEPEGGPLLPIIFVSANMFENRPEQLAALRCEGFVGKPVVESELLSVLARALQLEWLHQGPTRNQDLLGAGPSSPTEPALPPPWPQAWAEELRHLARMGNSLALKETLARCAAELPALAGPCAELRQMVDHFDFDGLLLRLPAADDEDDADEQDRDDPEDADEQPRHEPA